VKKRAGLNPKGDTVKGISLWGFIYQKQTSISQCMD